MGADLITYIVKGPAKLSEKSRAEAVKLAENIISACKEAVEKQDSGAGLSDKEIKQLQQLTGLDLDDNLESMAALNPECVVGDLYEAWAENFRDVNGRYDPDDENQKILVAGELSWGDEPEGAGYQALKNAERCGLFEFFGIR